MKKTILSLLVALMATTGAWAEGDAPEVKLFTVPSTWQNNKDAYTADDLPSDFVACSDDEAAAWAASCTEGDAVLIYSIDNVYIKVPKGSAKSSYKKEELFGTQNAGSKIYYTVASAATTVTVTEVAENQWQFTMPAYDVEVNTELWYILKQNGETPVDNKTKANVFLDRTLQAKGSESKAWSTFCAPFNIGNSAAEAGHHFDGTSLEGATVKEFTGSGYDASTQTLTLDFSDASSIVAGTPYLVQVDAEVVNPTFEGVTQNWTTDGKSVTATGGYVTFVPVLTPTTLTENDRTKLYLSGENTLYYPSQNVQVKGFRAYFQLNGLTAGDLPNGNNARAFVLNIDGDQTGIRSLTPDASPKGEGSIYSLDGRKVQNTTRKGVYIVNGKKVVVK